MVGWPTLVSNLAASNRTLNLNWVSNVWASVEAAAEDVALLDYQHCHSTLKLDWWYPAADLRVTEAAEEWMCGGGMIDSGDLIVRKLDEWLD